MPALSSTMTEGKIVSWLKAPGDKVKKGESIVVVESGEKRIGNLACRVCFLRLCAAQCARYRQ
jgi:hypothetical protein